MQIYQEMKTKRSSGDPASEAFWPRITTLLDFHKKSEYFTEDKSSPRCSGKQLQFWVQVEAFIKRHSYPKWINQNGEVISYTVEEDQGSTQSFKITPKEYLSSNEMTESHLVVSKILKNREMLSEVFDGKRILSESKRESESAAYSVKFLEHFEISRLECHLSQEDQLFSGLVESMLIDWVQHSQERIFTQAENPKSHLFLG